MPTLPTYQSKEQLQQVQRPNIGKQYGVGDVLGSIGQTMNARDELDAKIAEITTKNQIASAKISSNSKIALYQEEIKNNPEANPVDVQTEQFAKINDEESATIDSAAGVKQFQIGSELEFTKGRITGRAEFGKYQIEKKKQLSVVGREAWVSDPYRTYNDLERMGSEDIEDRTYTEAEVFEMESKSINAAALNDAASNPYGTLQALEGSHGVYDHLGETEKKKVKKAALNTIEQNKKLAKLHKGEMGVAVLKQVDIGGVPSKFYGNIAEAEATGVIDKAEAESMKLAYQRGRGVGQETSNKTFSKLSLQNSTIDDRITDNQMTDSLTYSKQIRDLYKNIYNAYGKKELTYTHFQKLLDDADRSTARKNEEVKRQLLDPEQSGKGYVSNQGAFDTFMLHTGGDIARSNKLMTRYITDKSEIEDDKMNLLLPTIITDDKKRRAEKATTLAIRLLTTKETGEKEQDTVTAYQRTPEGKQEKKEQWDVGVTYEMANGTRAKYVGGDEWEVE